VRVSGRLGDHLGHALTSRTHGSNDTQHHPQRLNHRGQIAGPARPRSEVRSTDPLRSVPVSRRRSWAQQCRRHGRPEGNAPGVPPEAVSGTISHRGQLGRYRRGGPATVITACRISSPGYADAAGTSSTVTSGRSRRRRDATARRVGIGIRERRRAMTTRDARRDRARSASSRAGAEP
jgi:hypothetical protein